MIQIIKKWFSPPINKGKLKNVSRETLKNKNKK